MFDTKKMFKKGCFFYIRKARQSKKKMKKKSIKEKKSKVNGKTVLLAGKRQKETGIDSL